MSKPTKPSPEPAELAMQPNDEPEASFGTPLVVGRELANGPTQAASYIPVYKRVHLVAGDTTEEQKWHERALQLMKNVLAVAVETDEGIRVSYQAGKRARWLVSHNYTPARILQVLEAKTPEAALEVGFSPPMDAQTWRILSNQCGVSYNHFDTVFELNNVAQYVANGLSARVLKHDFNVNVDMLIDDLRFDSNDLPLFSAQEWFSLGLRWRHMPHFRVLYEVIADKLGLTMHQLKEMFLADGEYVTSRGPDGHTHRVEIVNGQLVVEAGGCGDHTHLEDNGQLQLSGGHSHRKLFRVPTT